MEEGPELRSGDRLADLACHEYRCEREVSARQGLADAHDVRGDVRPLGGEHAARAGETGRDLVDDQKEPVLVGHVAQEPEAVGVVDVHAARTLEHRLDDDSGELVAVRRREGAHLCGPDLEGRAVRLPVLVAGRGGHLARRGRAWGEDLAGQDAREGRVHPVHGIAHAHRGERVTVVAASHGEEALSLRSSARRLVLERQLEGDLDRHRAGVGEEDMGHRSRGHRREALGEPDGGLVGQAAEHDVAEPAELLVGRRVEDGVAVAVDRAPPRGHRVDGLEPLALRRREAQADARSTLDGIRLGAVEGCVRVPDEAAVAGAERRTRRVRHWRGGRFRPRVGAWRGRAWRRPPASDRLPGRRRRGRRSRCLGSAPGRTPPPGPRT